MRNLFVRVFAILSLFLLVACGAGGGQGPLPIAQEQAVAFAASGPPTITVITMVNNRTGAGGHSALMVSGSQRVLFDPAGSYRPDYLTEQGDVLYGITDRHYGYYLSAHARNSHHVVMQSMVVSPEAAEKALALVQERGSVSSALCTNSTTTILKQVPGFEDIGVTFFPKRLMKQIAERPGVTTDKWIENDEGDVIDGIVDVVASE
ncbi:MAG: hypothetical protein ABJL99_13645 [Aliishimia sp.]